MLFSSHISVSFLGNLGNQKIFFLNCGMFSYLYTAYKLFLGLSKNIPTLCAKKAFFILLCKMHLSFN